MKTSLHKLIEDDASCLPVAAASATGSHPIFVVFPSFFPFLASRRRRLA